MQVDFDRVDLQFGMASIEFESKGFASKSFLWREDELPNIFACFSLEFRNHKVVLIVLLITTVEILSMFHQVTKAWVNGKEVLVVGESPSVVIVGSLKLMTVANRHMTQMTQNGKLCWSFESKYI